MTVLYTLNCFLFISVCFASKDRESLDSLIFLRQVQSTTLKLINQSSLFDSIHRQTPSSTLCNNRTSEIVVLVKSAPQNIHLRNILRLTWFSAEAWNVSQVSVHRYFLIGGVEEASMEELLRAEEIRYGDIVRQGFLDAYSNNTRKLILGLGWALESCPTVDFIAMIDDDYCLRPQKVCEVLSGVRESEKDRFITGHVWNCAKPIRDPSSKWFISKETFAFDTFPDYIGAGAFVVSGKLAGLLYKASFFVEYLFMDDVYLGLLLQRLLIVPIHTDLIYSAHEDRVPEERRSKLLAFHGCRHLSQHIPFLRV